MPLGDEPKVATLLKAVTMKLQVAFTEQSGKLQATMKVR